MQGSGKIFDKIIKDRFGLATVVVLLLATLLIRLALDFSLIQDDSLIVYDSRILIVAILPLIAIIYTLIFLKNREFLFDRIIHIFSLFVLAAYLIINFKTDLLKQEQVVVIYFLLFVDLILSKQFFLDLTRKIKLNNNDFAEFAFEASRPDVLISDLKPGKEYELGPGDYVPVDSVILSGRAALAERLFSAETDLVIKNPGEVVFSGSSLIKGNISCRAERTYQASYNSKINFAYSDLWSQQKIKLLTYFIILLAVLVPIYFNQITLETYMVLKLFLIMTTLYLLPRYLYLENQLTKQVLASLKKLSFLVQDIKSIRILMRIKNFILCHDVGNESATWEVQSFEVLDDRIDLKSLQQILINILAQVSEEISSPITKFLEQDLEEWDLLDVVDLVTYGKGLYSAKIKGAEITIGDEELMLSRGIELQKSDTNLLEGQKLLFVAINSALAARCILRNSYLEDYSSLMSGLVSQKFKPYVFSQQNMGVISEFAKKINLPINNLYCGLIGDAFKKQVLAIPDSLLYSPEVIDPQVLNSASLSVGNFDYRVNAESNFKAFCLNLSPKVILPALMLIKKYKKIILFLRISVVIFFIGLFSLAFLYQLSISLYLFYTIIFSFLLYLLVWFLAVRRKL